MHVVDYPRLCVCCKVRGATKGIGRALGGSKVCDGVLAFKSAGDKYIAV
jgi:hypothetical protein